MRDFTWSVKSFDLKPNLTIGWNSSTIRNQNMVAIENHINVRSVEFMTANCTAPMMEIITADRIVSSRNKRLFEKRKFRRLR
jgi:hypothetical protein